MSFDELFPKDLLKLLQKVLQKLDSKSDLDLLKNTEEEKAKLGDLLNMLNYPEAETEKVASSVFDGSKKHIYPVLYFALQNFEELKKRAYLGYYLVPVNVPEEFMMEQDMKLLKEQYEELRAVFQNEHQELEALKAQSPDYESIQKGIWELEKERDQLRIKIKTYVHEKTEKKEFQDLLKATNLLRKEQEKEQKLQEKLREQQGYMENCEHILLVWQQRLFDAQSAYGQETSASEMLSALRNKLNSV